MQEVPIVKKKIFFNQKKAQSRLFLFEFLATLFENLFTSSSFDITHLFLAV